MILAADKCTGECLKSGPWGLAIVLILAVAAYFLFRSMSKHMKKTRQHFGQEAPDETPAGAPAEETSEEEPHELGS